MSLQLSLPYNSPPHIADRGLCGVTCEKCGEAYQCSAKTIKYAKPGQRRLCRPCRGAVGDHGKGRRGVRRLLHQWEIRPDGTAAIQLGCGNFLTIDASDLPLVQSFPWWSKKSNRTRYAAVNVFLDSAEQRRVYLHHLIVGAPSSGFETDHIDRNGLNNTRGNLRTVTIPQNRQNSRKRLGCRSEFKGVLWSKELNKWRARFRRKYLGTFERETDAARAWDKVAHSVYGDHAALNFPGEVKAHHDPAFEREVALHARSTGALAHNALRTSPSEARNA